MFNARFMIDGQPKIKVRNTTRWWNGTRRITIDVPEDYPGLNDSEQKTLNQGLTLIEQAFLRAQKRLG